MRHYVDVVRTQARTRPDQAAFTFLENGETESDTLTFAELDRAARAVAVQLQDRTRQGDRALLLFPPGLDFVRAFIGCLYAGVVAVPVYPPRRNRSLDRLVAVAADAGAAVALTSAGVAKSLDRGDAIGLDVPLVVTDSAESGRADDWREPTRTRDDIAFLQYTSGSTGTPKGVMVTHGNLLHNCELIKVAYSHSSDSVFVSWLPVFHDMGLVGMVLEPIYTGSHSVLMEPAAFLQKPARWLRAITKYGGTTSGAPNSAYELCVRRVSDEDRATLDLRTWQFAYNGAEPVRASTLQRFHDAFAPCGLRWEAVQPCYGMAETTLLVSIAGIGQAPTIHTDAGGQTFVSSGRRWLDERVVIVDPETGQRQAEGETGEIWVASDSVAAGYWNRPDETAAAFNAHLVDDAETSFFRTGDLGFERGDQLFVTGRLKDLIIIRGRNLYPQDIEYTAGSAHEALSSDSVAAFSIDADSVGADEAEQLVVVCEVSRERLQKLNADEALQAVRQAVAEEHEVDPAAIVLLRTLALPKTSSGKVQRRACRDRFLAGTLDVVGQWRRPLPTQAPPSDHAVTYGSVREWLVLRIAAQAGMASQDVKVTDAFSRFGLDSQRAVVLSGELQEWLGRPVSATVAYDFPSIDALARHLTGDTEAAAQAKGVTDSAEPIAIVGMACRFPGADSPEAFWDALLRGADAVGPAPTGRPLASALGMAGFLADVDQFDAAAFGVTPREAEGMDPQQRLLLEVATEAVERAGLTGETLAGSRTGTFIGISNLDYLRLQTGLASASDVYAGTGNALSIAANRLSYHFDLRGPSWAVDTACSSSLVAVHQACQSLRQGESDRALCGGVNLILSPELTGVFTRAGMMSATHRCRTFDADADGYVRGEGVGVVVLERLSDAVRDGRLIHGVIRGSAVNQDGRSHGLTAPNGPAQQAVIREALHAAGVAPAAIGYVEAHGTGTPLGDPIEMNALVAVLGEGRTASDRCVVGSVKTNIGHLEAAAGIAGLIKVALLLQHETIPPHVHFTRLNPHIEIGGTSFVIPVEATPWSRGATPRRAGVSSFGFGGTNAHVILEEPAQRPAPAAPTRRFDRQRYWFETAQAHPLLGRRLPESALAPESLVWESELSTTQLPFLSGHQVQGATVLPYAAFVEMALAAAAQVPGAGRQVTRLRLHHPLVIAESHPVRVQTVMAPAPSGTLHVRVYCQTGLTWTMTASAWLTRSAVPAINSGTR